MMLDRLRELFSQLLRGKNPLNKKGTKDDYSGPKNYSDLPVEMRIEVAKHMDFLTRHRFRQCSHQSFQIVNSLHFEIPIVKIKTCREHNVLAVSVFEGIEKVSTIYIWVSKECCIPNPVVTFNNEIMDTYKYYDNVIFKKSSDFSFDTLSHQLFKALAHENLKIEKFMLELDGSLPAVRLINEYFPDEKLPFIMTRCARTYSGYEYVFDLECEIVLDFTIHFLPDPKRKMIYAGSTGHPYVPGRERFFDNFQIVNAHNWLNVVSRLSSDSFDRYWMPGMKTTKKDFKWISKNLTVVIIEKSKNHSKLWLPLDDDRFGFLIRISKCGVAIEKLPIDTDLLEISGCGLQWMCPNCNSFFENWVYRTDFEVHARNIRPFDIRKMLSYEYQT